MAAVATRSSRLSTKSDSGSDLDSESDRGAREAEPMEVEEGEVDAQDVSVNRSLKELLPDTSRRYENKAGAFITGIDVNSKEAIEKKEKRARRFHFHGEVCATQRDIFLDKEAVKKAIPNVRMEAVHVMGVDDMSTQDIFGYFKEYPPAHIEWIDDTSCNVVWLDDNTAIRALINTSRVPDPDHVVTDSEPDARPGEVHKSRRSPGSDGDDDDDEEEGAVEEEVKKSEKDDGGSEARLPAEADGQGGNLSLAERESLLRNDLRPATKAFKGNKILLRFATQDDKKELGAARRSRYYMKYGNPNYGGMKGILSNSWKRRFHNRRVQRDVIKSKKPLIGDSLGHTPPYTQRHSADLVNLPEEPIKEEEEEDEDYGDEDMDSEDRVVEFKDKADKGGASAVYSRPRGRQARSPSPWSESDEMDYDLELKMISTPSPKKSKKMTIERLASNDVTPGCRKQKPGGRVGVPKRAQVPVAKEGDRRPAAAFGEETGDGSAQTSRGQDSKNRRPTAAREEALLSGKGALSLARLAQGNARSGQRTGERRAQSTGRRQLVQDVPRQKDKQPVEPTGRERGKIGKSRAHPKRRHFGNFLVLRSP
ncbi:nuclear cap-binding protein subunit 3 isoform X3 [Stigmatopora nigra]